MAIVGDQLILGVLRLRFRCLDVRAFMGDAIDRSSGPERVMRLCGNLLVWMRLFKAKMGTTL